MNRERRHLRVRAKIKGTVERPRLCVFRSNQCLYAQLIDDVKGITLAAADSKKSSGYEQAGGEIAKQALEKKINQCVFDRGGYAFHGKVAALAEGARKGGLKF